MKPSPDEINQLFTNHKQALRSVKPMVDCFRTSTPKVNKNNKKQLQNYNAFDLVYKTFKSVNQQKGFIDNKVPDTSNIRKYVQIHLRHFKDKFRNNRQDKFQAEEHQRELRSIRQRIENCGNLEQRKKRNYDPITHPTFMMRKAAEGVKDVSIEPFAKTVLQQNQPKATRPSSSKTYKNMTATATAHNRPSSAVKSHHDQQSQVNHSHQFNQTGDMSKTKDRKRPSSSKPPNKKPQPEFPECNFKSIINYIIDKKMYKDIDLRVLYERLCFKYGDEVLEPIWYNVKQELEQ